MRISRRVALAALGSMPALLPWSARAAFPDRPIRIIVPFAPGGNVDIVTRVVGEKLLTELGQPIVVENRTGAGGSIGAEQVARATPDGYTLLMGSSGPLTVNPFVQAKMGYDPLKDFVPIGLTSLVPHAIMVHESVPAKSLQELIALSKTQQVTTGTAGAGSATHLTLERFNMQSGARLVHVPYRGGGALIPDLLAGNISSAMTEFSSALPQHRGGKARFLAIAATQRSALASDVPTMSESGVTDFTAASYVGLLAPTGTPAEIVERLQKALAAALTQPATQDKLRELGSEVAAPAQMTSAGFAAYIAQEYERSREAAQLAGLKKE